MIRNPVVPIRRAARWVVLALAGFVLAATAQDLTEWTMTLNDTGGFAVAGLGGPSKHISL